MEETSVNCIAAVKVGNVLNDNLVFTDLVHQLCGYDLARFVAEPAYHRVSLVMMRQLSNHAVTTKRMQHAQHAAISLPNVSGFMLIDAIC